MTHSTRKIKIYRQTYELPDLNDPKFEEVRGDIKSRQQLIQSGQRQVSGGFLGIGRQIEELGFEERFQELEALVKDYDYYIKLLQNNQDIYQNFFVQLANEIKKIVMNQCQNILERERVNGTPTRRDFY
ncbi:MAG: hypothetical protein AB4058_00565 [Microcystaceae cyanobacterium]